MTGSTLSSLESASLVENERLEVRKYEPPTNQEYPDSYEAADASEPIVVAPSAAHNHLASRDSIVGTRLGGIVRTNARGTPGLNPRLVCHRQHDDCHD